MNSCYFYVADLCTLLTCSLLKPEAWLPSTCLINFTTNEQKTSLFSHCFWLCPVSNKIENGVFFIFVFLIFSVFAKTPLLHCWLLNSVKIQDQVYVIVINWLIHTKCAQRRFSLSLSLWLVLLVNAVQHLILPARLSTAYGSHIIVEQPEHTLLAKYLDEHFTRKSFANSCDFFLLSAVIVCSV